MAELPWDKLVRPIHRVSAMVKGQGPSAPERLLKQVGALMLAQAQRAFIDQKLGTQPWKARYPNQAAPKLNIAGALMDLQNGANIKDRRFVDRPAVIDTSHLRQSLSDRHGHLQMLGMWSVEVGTVVLYGGIHQWGGTNTIPITKAIFNNLAAWLKRMTGAFSKKSKAASGKAKSYQRAQKLQKVGAQVAAVNKHLVSIVATQSKYTVRVVERPFLGWTRELSLKVEDLMRKKLA